MELLAPVPRKPVRVREEWAEVPGYGWLQLGKCWFKADGMDGDAKPWEMMRRSSDVSEGQASANADLSSQAVDILATLERVGQPDALVLVLVYRPPVDNWVIEMPAGMIDPGESVEEAARRELMEETGFSARVDEETSKQRECGDSSGAPSSDQRTNIPNLLAWPDPWKSRENYHTCQLTIDGNDPANNLGVVSQALEPGEHIIPILVPLVHEGSGLIRQLKEASENNNWLLEARLSGIAQGLALASQLRGRL
jgi:ADP-ribose pyrophosphatase